MKVTAFDDAREFQRLSEPLLADHEAEYNLFIGILASVVARGGQRHSETPLVAVVGDQDQPEGFVLRTPPNLLLLTELPPASIPMLANWLNERRIELPGVMAPRATSDAFAAEWSRRSRCRVRLAHAARTHRLSRVIAAPSTPGWMRPASIDDVKLLASFAAGFTRDIGHAPRDQAPAVRRRIESGGLFVWANPRPVAMANGGNPTPHGVRINWVYTPPEHRRRGYATALVAQLSQHLLDSGRRFCFLFTDLANPTANNIYRKIGYEGVCDYAEYRFE